jgi:DNA-binding transcriptional ArsR family regulator
LPKGRPKDSSPETYQKLYARLLKGPLWKEDWKSTGLARSTVYERLSYLWKIGLVTSRKVGKRKLYDLSPLQDKNGIITKNHLDWLSLLNPRLTKREKERIKRKTFLKIKELELENKTLWPGFELASEFLNYFDKVYDLPQSQDLFKILEEIKIDWIKIPIMFFLKNFFYLI